MLSRIALLSLVALAAPKPAAVRYLALGDSFTIGTGSGEDKAFPARIVAALEAKGTHATLSNLAVNGYSTQEILDFELPKIGELKPTVVTLAVGANDIVRGRDDQGYRANLKRLFKELADKGIKADTIYCLPQPDWSRSPVALGFGEPDEIYPQISLYNDILKQEAKAAGAHWVDLFDLMEKQARAGKIASDGLHPNAASHQEWADVLLKTLPLGTR